MLRYMFTGVSCAGVVSAAVACFFMGLVMLLWTLSDTAYIFISDSVLESSLPAIGSSLIIWLGGWYFLHSSWKSRYISRKTAYKIAVILTIAGFSGTFLSILRSLTSYIG